METTWLKVPQGRGRMAAYVTQLDGSLVAKDSCRCVLETPEHCPIDVHRVRYVQAHPMWERWTQLNLFQQGERDDE